MHADDISDVATTSAIEMGNHNSSLIKDRPDDSSTPLPNIQPPNDLYKQGAVGSCSNSEDVEEYSKLLNKYYELEEQRQKVLQELQQLGSWNYQETDEVSGSCAHWSAYSSQGYQPPADYVSNSTSVCSCCPYGCQLVVAPCTTLPNYSTGGACDGKIHNASAAQTTGRSSRLEDKDIVRTAMGAAEKAISTMKTKSSEPEGLEKNVDSMMICTNSKTDLPAVLNAWYAAGFYTAK
ncbi:hypothetical protein RJ641_035102 [Dillenia turbinata]|uniref:Uncharacterized protein n=1 Tax=Dillenia turbinata TaxID=194707 RepID=A0AAN8VWQ8_9MAGN